MKKILNFVIAFLFILLMTSCKEDNMKEVSNAALKNAILNYDFYYEYIVPGKNLSNELVWDGYSDGGNGYIQIDISERLYTYQASYGRINDGYYLVYINDSLLSQATSYLKEKEDSYTYPYYPFSSYEDDDHIDGKYLFSLQKQNIDLSSPKIYYVDDAKDIKKVIKNETLVFICKTKEATILENISLKETLNHNMTMICKYSYDFKTNEFNKDLSIIESNAVNEFEQEFDRIAIFRKSYETREYAYYPLSLDTDSGYLTIDYRIYDIEGKKYLKLPITTKLSGQTVSLLDSTIDFYVGDDFYGNHKLEFSEAMVSSIPTETINNNTYAYFDLEKVKDIIS